MLGVQNFFNPPATLPGNGPREQSQSQLDQLQRRRTAILMGTGGIGLDQLDSIDKQIQQLTAQRDMHCPSPDRPANWAPHLNAAGTTQNLSSALGPAVNLTSGSFPSWMKSGF